MNAKIPLSDDLPLTLAQLQAYVLQTAQRMVSQLDKLDCMRDPMGVEWVEDQIDDVIELMSENEAQVNSVNLSRMLALHLVMLAVTLEDEQEGDDGAD